METFSALLAFCAGNSPVHGEFPAQRPVTRSFDVFFDLRWIRSWVNNGEAGDLRRHQAHYDVIVMWWIDDIIGNHLLSEPIAAKFANTNLRHLAILNVWYLCSLDTQWLFVNDEEYHSTQCECGYSFRKFFFTMFLNEYKRFRSPVRDDHDDVLCTDLTTTVCAARRTWSSTRLFTFDLIELNWYKHALTGRLHALWTFNSWRPCDACIRQ